MSDTLIDPPPPETQPDPDPAELAAFAPPPPPSAPTPPRAPRPPMSGKALAAILVGLVVVLLAASATVFYLFFWRYEPTAKRHIPGNANIIVRVEASDILLFSPVRRHLWPIVVGGPSGDAPPPPKPGKSRVERIKDATGVNLATDLREVVVASVDADSWVLIAGGRIPKGRFVKGLEKVLREEGVAGWSLSGELLVGPHATVAQADDGSILVGTDVRIVSAALPASEDHKAFGLPEGKALAFVVTRDAWGGAAGVLAKTLPKGAVLSSIDRAVGSVTLGDKPLVEMRLEPSQGIDATALASDVESILGALRLVLLLAPDFAGEKEAIAGTKIEAKSGVVLLTTPWPLAGLDKGAERLATVISALR